MTTIKKLLLPKRRSEDTVMGTRLHDKSVAGERLYFLAGPIRGADDWQAKAIKLIREKDPNCYIACPCRYGNGHPLYQYSMDYVSEDTILFHNQTTWERYYLKIAASRGAVIFWLPEESKTNPRKKEDGPYARDTYGELGRWSVISARAKRPPYPAREETVNLVIGAEENFPGLSVIQKNFVGDHFDDYNEHSDRFPIYFSLEETISEAVKLGKKTNPQPLFNSENC